MVNTFSALLSSRKFWVGTLTVIATLGAVLLRSLDKIPADALLPTIGAVTTLGLGVIGSIAWEDAALKTALPPPPPFGETLPTAEELAGSLTDEELKAVEARLDALRTQNASEESKKP
jgi:hypothetical protein